MAFDERQTKDILVGLLGGAMLVGLGVPLLKVIGLGGWPTDLVVLCTVLLLLCWSRIVKSVKRKIRRDR